jgi:ribosome maturation factor RimP
MDLVRMLEPTVTGLGYELVNCEWFGRGKLRVLIDRPAGVTVDDCALVSNQLTRYFAVEGFDYDRLEVSSPGLDRPLRKTADFERFRGERAQVKLRVPLEGRRNFSGVLGALTDGMLELDADGKRFSLELANIEKARLIPNI